MVRSSSTLSLCGVLLAAVLPSIAQADLMQVTGVPAGDSLNVRSGPRVKAADVGDLHEGDVINVEGTSVDGKWSQIRFNGQIAWVSSRYLTEAAGGGQAPVIGPNVVSGIAADDSDGGLVVRAEPDRNASRLEVLPSGTQVHIIQLSRDQKWGMIAASDGVGWVSTRYLTPQSEASPRSQGSTVAPDGGPLPAVFVVSGVASDDRLWVREAPNASAGKIAGLPEGAVINVDAVAQGNWVQVTINGQIGYLNARYLTRQPELATQTLSGFPLGITCRGTEPFWTLTIAQDRTTEYNPLIGPADPLTSLTLATPSTGGGYPFSFLAGPYSGALDYRTCSDGMSDISYTMAIAFTRQDPNGSVEQLYGCCNVD